MIVQKAIRAYSVMIFIGRAKIPQSLASMSVMQRQLARARNLERVKLRNERIKREKRNNTAF
ncbi:hypothetical protein L4C31_18925 [Aliivibrio sifiae]